MIPCLGRAASVLSRHRPGARTNGQSDSKTDKGWQPDKLPRTGNLIILLGCGEILCGRTTVRVSGS